MTTDHSKASSSFGTQRCIKSEKKKTTSYVPSGTTVMSSGGEDKDGASRTTMVQEHDVICQTDEFTIPETDALPSSDVKLKPARKDASMPVVRFDPFSQTNTLSLKFHKTDQFLNPELAKAPPS